MRSRGFDVKAGALQKGEVGFIALKGNERTYYQVALSVVNETVLAREMSALERVPDSHPKTIITLDGLLSGVTGSGIRVEGFLSWSAAE